MTGVGGRGTRAVKTELGSPEGSSWGPNTPTGDSCLTLMANTTVFSERHVVCKLCLIYASCYLQVSIMVLEKSILISEKHDLNKYLTHASKGDFYIFKFIKNKIFLQYLKQHYPLFGMCGNIFTSKPNYWLSNSKTIMKYL